MIDIETLDTVNDSVVTSICMVAFNDEGFDSDYLMIHFNVQDQLDRGRTVSASTIKWWMDQKFNPFHEDHELINNSVQLRKLISYVRGIMDELDDPMELSIWGNPPKFDLGIVENLLTHYEFPTIWNHYNLEDVRTCKRRLGKANYADITNKKPHDPLHDCIYQIDIVNRLKKIINENIHSPS